MDPNKESIISIRVKKEHKQALQNYCKNKGISESNYCIDKLTPYFDVLMVLNNSIRDERGNYDE